MTFGQRLKKLRKDKGLSQEQLALMLKKSRSTVAGYETDDRYPEFFSLIEIANLFKVSSDYLLGLSDNPYCNVEQSQLEKNTNSEIEQLLSEAQNTLQNSINLTLAGNPASPEAVQSIIDGIKFGLEQAKLRNVKRQ